MNKCLSFNDCCQILIKNSLKYISINTAHGKKEVSMQFKDNQYCCQKYDNSASVLDIYNSFLSNNIKTMERIDKQTIECIDFDGSDLKIRIDQTKSCPFEIQNA